MKMLSLFIFSVLVFLQVNNSHSSFVNNRPIIGVLTQEILQNSKLSHNATTQIFASYVKFIEASGARVVPIWIEKTYNYYEDILGKINGVLFPGGNVYLNGTGYGRSGQIIIDIVTKMNDKGDYFPLWGTCLGFELLNYVVAKKSWMLWCDAENMVTPLRFVDGYKNSRIFDDLDDKLGNMMQTKDVAIHFHRWCLTPQNFSISGLDKHFKVLALNRDKKNITFVSIIEAKNYPYYGTAFHPEKNNFEWVFQKNIPHTLEAVKTSQYFGNFFVNEARKNKHQFPSKAAEDEVLMYNYNPTFTGKIRNNSAQQRYYFYN